MNPAMYVMKLAKLDIARGSNITIYPHIIQIIVNMIEHILTNLWYAKVCTADKNKNIAINQNRIPDKNPTVIVEANGKATAIIPNIISIKAMGLNL